MDLRGRSYNFWVVKGVSPSKNARKYWLCKCACGKERAVLQYALTSGKSKSCGCRSGKDLTGQKFGSLRALAPVIRGDGIKVWRCRCDCGKETLVRAQALKADRTISCGCSKTKPRKYWKLVPSSNPQDFSTEQIATLWLFFHRMQDDRPGDVWMRNMLKALRPWMDAYEKSRPEECGATLRGED